MSRRRDGLLAFVTLTLIVAISFATGTGAAFADPVAAVVGGFGTLVGELLLYRVREPVRVAWARRPVRIGAIGCVVLVVVGAARFGVEFVVAALAWGTVAYLLLLGILLARDGVGRR